MTPALRKTFADPNATASQLAAAVADARKLAADLQTDVAKLDADRLDLTVDDAARARAKNRLAEARDKLELAERLVSELAGRCAVAETAETDAARLGRYDAAKAMAEAAAKMLVKAYPRLVADALGMVRTLAEAQVEVDQVNRDLPVGVLPLLDPEIAVRGVPGRAREVISDTEVEAWTRMDQDRPVEEAHAAKIYDCGKGWGKATGDVQAVYLRARFRRVEFRDSISAIQPLPLASFLRLPSVFGPGVIWGHHQTVGFDPALLASFNGEDAPENVAPRAAAAEQAKPDKPTSAVAPTKIEWTMLGYVDETGMRPSEPYTAGRSQAAKTGLPLGLNSRHAGGARR